MNKKSAGFIIIRLVVVVMLLWALGHNPYGYYIILRWIVCPIFLYCTLRSYRTNNDAWTWIFGVSTAIYNPIFPLQLGRSIWIVVNIVSVVLIIVSLFILKILNKKDENNL